MNNNKVFPPKWYLPTIIFISITVFLYYVLAFSMEHGFHFLPKAKADNWGQFGSYFGGIVTPFISFVSLLAILKTVSLQQESIKKTEADAKENKDFADEQRKALNLQRFETTFFNMLNQINLIMDSYKTGNKEGSDYFKGLINKLYEHIDKGELKLEEGNQTEIDRYFKALSLITDFGNLTKHIYNIIKLINSAQETIDSTENYFDILFGFLSNSQKLFFNACYFSSFFKKEKELLACFIDSGIYKPKTMRFLTDADVNI
jgi:hypothetical protein